MTGNEFSNQFDVEYNNITSNQAPGLNEYEKCVFLTKAQNEILKNYFLPQSNPKQAGFDDNQKRQMDFSSLMESIGIPIVVSGALPEQEGTHDPRGIEVGWYPYFFLVINESLKFKESNKTQFQRQVIALNYNEYTRLMSKPYKEPLKGQAWRLIVKQGESGSINPKIVEIIINHNDLKWVSAEDTQRSCYYVVRYIRKPKPIIIAPIDSYGVSIDGHDGGTDDTDPVDGLYTLADDGLSILDPCELDDMLHEEILQRAVELAKIAWDGTLTSSVQAGQRSE